MLGLCTVARGEGTLLQGVQRETPESEEENLEKVGPHESGEAGAGR